MFKAGLFLIITVFIAQCSEAPAPEGIESDAALAGAPPEAIPSAIVTAAAPWETVATGFVYTESPVSDGAGGVYFAEPVQNRLYHLHADGRQSVFADETQMNMGLVRGADGRLYGCRNRGAQIVAYRADGSFEVLLQGKLTPLPDKPKAPGEFCNDLAINMAGGIWFTDRVNQQVRYLAPDGSVRVVADGFRPNGIVLSADRRTLVVTDSNEPRLWAFAVSDDGALELLPGFFPPVRTVDRLGDEVIAEGRPGTNGMTVDRDGRYYLTSFYGIQVFGPEGQYIGTISKPVGFVSNLGFAGENLEYLYATGLNGLYRRLMQARGQPSLAALTAVEADQLQ